jgi:hypothetical protein
MAFPSTFNINYYEGDTYEFKIYPKNSIGGVFNLSPSTWEAKFTIANGRGSTVIVNGTSTAVTQILCDVIIEQDSTVSCEIKPAKGRQLVAGVNYVYDVEVKNTATGKTFTLLNGNITVTADVSGAV